jgi:hypothetical protein
MAKAIAKPGVKRERINIIKKARIYRDGNSWFAYNVVSGLRITAADTKEDCERKAVSHGYDIVHIVV